MTTPPPPTIDDIICYPVKGLGGFSVEQARLLAGRGIRHDRRFGLASQPTLEALYRHDKWRPWEHCHTLKKNEKLARLSAVIADAEDGDELCLTLSADDGQGASGRPAVAAERATLEEFLRDFLSLSDLFLVDSEQAPLWDDAIHVTLLNTASVADLAAQSKTALSPARFRANIVFSGMAAWREESLSGGVCLGTARGALGGGVPRCLATTVNPDTAARDLKVPKLIYACRRHSDMGVFATIVESGDVSVGMELSFESA